MSFAGDNLRIDPSSPLHSELLQRLLSRYNIARAHIQANAQRWQDADKLFTAYLPKSVDEALREQDRRLTGRQYPVRIEVPYSYAMLMAAHTYWATVFLSRTPVFQYMARTGDLDPDAPLAVEALIDYQLSKSHSLPALYYWLLDAPRYGYGVLGCYWDVRYKNIATIERHPPVLERIFGKRARRVIKRVLDFEGNVLFNVRPHDFLIDPRVPVWRFQDGEFCGRIVSVTISDLLEGADAGKYMNVEAIRQGRDAFSPQAIDRMPTGVPQHEIPEQSGTAPYSIDKQDPGLIELIELFVRVVPKRWGLGNTNSPEIWRFTIANRSTIIEARPFNAMHGRFPFFVLPYELDPYVSSPRSMLDVCKDLNYLISWLFNSHIQNVRAALNNQFVVDPTAINLKDFEHGGEGLLIRLRPEAWGKDVRTAIMQLPVADVTRTHLQDVQVVEQIMQRVTGINDQIMGLLSPGGRKTATEVRASTNFGINRLKTQAEFFSAVGFSPLARVMLQNAQQYLSQEWRLRVRWRDEVVTVSPESVVGDFDFVPVDGTMPVDRYAQATLWTQLLQQLAQTGAIQQFDVLGIVNHIAQLMGVKSLEKFKVQVKPDEEVLNAAARGELVGAPQALGGGMSPTAGGATAPTPAADLGSLASRME